jgi:MATE family multidrug resistance protein
MGWMGMGIVDTMMVGRVSAQAIGAVSLGSVLFYAVAMFGSGLMLGLDTLVSQAYGARRPWIATTPWSALSTSVCPSRR